MGVPCCPMESRPTFPTRDTAADAPGGKEGARGVPSEPADLGGPSRPH